VERFLEAHTLIHVFRIVQCLFLGLAGLALALSLLAARRDRAAAGRSPHARNALFAFFALLLAGVYGYQATWQLAGFARPPFVEFMRRFNLRPDNPVARIARGRLLDRHGVELAGNSPDDGAIRQYPFGSAACHVTGYLSPVFGLSGLEQADSASLYGATLDTWDQRSRFTDNLLDRRRRVNGNDRTLTLDIRLQQEAVRLLGDRAGAVVALDPRDGALLVLASTPGFDPAHLTPELFEPNPDSPLLNRALHGLYPPGSTFKLVIAAAAIEAGFTGELDCPAAGYSAERGAPPIRDHEALQAARDGTEWLGLGRITMRTALRLSSNVYFARLGVMLGGGRLGQMTDRLALTDSITVFEGSSSAIASSPCRVPPPRDQTDNELAQMSIGQGRLMVTPLQMAVLTGAIANHGLAMRPRLDAAAKPQALRYYVRRNAAAALTGFLREAVAEGTGQGADVEGLEVAGKTGTAQTSDGDDHAWFVCFAPVGNPRLALAVVVEHGGAGSQAAVPVAAGLLRLARDIGWLEE
jgi:peptidoglycan glycosyltransferase